MIQKEHILITGGNGMIGSQLAPLLMSAGHNVSFLSRKAGSKGKIKIYQWDIKAKKIDMEAFRDATVIINLAGSNLNAKRWTKRFKEEIISSRVESAKLIFDTLKNTDHKVKTFLSPSGTGYYGETGDFWADETSNPGDDFLAKTCIQWEKAARQFSSLGIRVAIFRIGFVLSPNGGAVPALSLPVKMFVGAPLGSGDQYLSWIHIDDVCRIYDFAISNEKINGVYNACAPGPVPQEFFMKQLARALRRPLWPFSIAPLFLKILLGEKSEMVTTGQRVSGEKLRHAGFKFKFSDISAAIRDCIEKSGTDPEKK